MTNNLRNTITLFCLCFSIVICGQSNDEVIRNTAKTVLPSFFPLAKRDFIRLSSAYGYRKHPISAKIRKHEGIDLVAKTGKPVFASARGIVVKNDKHTQYGNRVVIAHSKNIQTLYAHLSKTFVKYGQIIEEGEILGQVGQTGRATGPHLHYEILVNRKKIDPIVFWNIVNKENGS